MCPAPLLSRRDVRRSLVRLQVSAVGAMMVAFTVLMVLMGLTITPSTSPLVLVLLTPVFPLTFIGVMSLIAPARRLPRCPVCHERLEGGQRTTVLTGRCPACTSVIVADMRPRRILAVRRLDRRHARRLGGRALRACAVVGAVSTVAIWVVPGSWGFVGAYLSGGFLAPACAWAWGRTRERRYAGPALANLAALASLAIHVMVHWP